MASRCRAIPPYHLGPAYMTVRGLFFVIMIDLRQSMRRVVRRRCVIGNFSVRRIMRHFRQRNSRPARTIALTSGSSWYDIRVYAALFAVAGVIAAMIAVHPF